MRYSNSTDKCFLITAYTAATIWGACMPALVLFFGEMIDSIATIETASDSLTFQAKMMAMVGVVSMIVAWF
jgi:hypothetical protein